jgi:lipoprotein-anchoring transpeptidase ErfK/SrfK
MDPAATLQQAAVIASPQISWGALQTRWNPPAVDLRPVVRFDQAVAESQLTHWAQQVDRPAQDAALRLENGQPVVTPSQAGIALDVSTTLDAVAADPLGTLAGQHVRLVFKPVPPAVTDVSAAQAQVNALLNLKLGGVIYDPIKDEKIPWQVAQDQVAGWVRLSQDNNGYQATLARDRLVAYVADLSHHVDLGPDRVIDPLPDANSFADQVLAGQAPVLIARYLPTEYTVQSYTTLLQVGFKVGMQLWRLEKANPTVNPTALAPGQKLVVPSKSDLLPLPVVANKRIVVSITRQRMDVYENGEQIREFVISTGIASSPTQPGVYQVQTHDVNAYASNWNLWMPHWLGIYEAWPGFMNGIHGLPMLSNGVRLWANVLGKPASYGCVILNLDNAAWLFDWAENGVVVEIQP